jgi:DNA-binding transcriptional ArsR family regulator
VYEQLEQEASLLYEKMCQGIADPKRILILYSLRERPQRVSELAEVLKMPQPTVSRHLKILRDRSLVLADREGTAVTYSLAEPDIVEALDIMRAVLRSILRRESELVQLSEI